MPVFSPVVLLLLQFPLTDLMCNKLIPSSPWASCGLDLHSQKSWLAKGSVHLSSAFATSFNQNVSVKSAGSVRWRPPGSSAGRQHTADSCCAPELRCRCGSSSAGAGSARTLSWQFRTAPLRPPRPVRQPESCSVGPQRRWDLHCSHAGAAR